MKLAFALSVALFSVPSLAFAQDAEPPTEPDAEEPAPTAPAAKAEVSAGGEVVAKAKKKKKKTSDDEEDVEGEEGEEGAAKESEGMGPGRFRGGVSGNIGAFVPGPIVMLGVEGRLGYQINDLMAVYGGFGGMAGLGFGVSVNDDGASSSISAGAALFANAVFEVTLADVFFVGAGPALLWGSFVTAEQAISTSGNTASASESTSVFAGVMPGIKLRTGVGFGKNRPDRRKQFTLAFDGTLVFGQRYAASVSAGESVEAAASTGVAVGFLPMLSLGFDAK